MFYRVSEMEERLQKILAERGMASRRKAEEWIAQGHVKVNGRVAQLGDKADARRDVILVHGKKIAAAEQPVYLMLHKPRGFVTTLSDEKDRKCVADLMKDVPARVFPVGRLDRQSEGLLLMTNDGDFANAMMHPAAHVPKYYRVTVRGEVTDEQQAHFCEGVMLDGKKTAPSELRVVSQQPDRTVLEVTLFEGRNRQIRRMCEVLGWEVARLRRIAIGSVKLGMLPAGQWRYLEPKEVRSLLQASQTQKKIAAAYIKAGVTPRKTEKKGRAR